MAHLGCTAVVRWLPFTNVILHYKRKVWFLFLLTMHASLVTQMVQHVPTMQETRVQSLGWEDLLEKAMATHSITLAWKIPWMEEPGRLQSMGSQRVRHDWATSLSFSPCVLSHFSHVWLFATPWTVACQTVHGDSPGKNSRVGCHALLQRIFPTQGSNLCLFCLLHWQVDSAQP